MIWTKFLGLIFIPPIAAMLTVCAMKQTPTYHHKSHAVKHGHVTPSPKWHYRDDPTYVQYDHNDLPAPEAIPTPSVTPHKTPVPLPPDFDTRPKI